MLPILIGNRYLQKKYQFRSRKRKLLNQNTAAEPWLKWGDLFGNSELVNNQQNTPSINSGLSVTPVAQSKPGLKKTNKKLSKKLANLPAHESDVGDIIPKPNHNHQVEIQPDWIEVKANSIEYEQHLLEKILKLLDRTMLWLEEILVKGVNLLQRLWRRK
ncbi:hypothetical protein [Nostoc piscinale]|uniref:hypothetical protein n=1 Tax=Nostoc piscinale TaxID=224012 RepID=UPI000781EC90|nr:hypothetical protein [Nostoc piscinale]